MQPAAAAGSRILMAVNSWLFSHLLARHRWWWPQLRQRCRPHGSASTSPFSFFTGAKSAGVIFRYMAVLPAQ